MFLDDLLFPMVLVHLVCPELMGKRGQDEKREGKWSLCTIMIKMDSLVLLLVQEAPLGLEVPWSPGETKEVQ